MSATALQHEHRCFVRGYMLESNPATPEHARALMEHCARAWHAYKAGPATSSPRALEVNPGGGGGDELVPLIILAAGGVAVWHFVPGVRDLVHGIAHGTSSGAANAATKQPGASAPAPSANDDAIAHQLASSVGINLSCAQAFVAQFHRAPNSLDELNTFRKGQPAASQCCDHPPC